MIMKRLYLSNFLLVVINIIFLIFVVAFLYQKKRDDTTRIDDMSCQAVFKMETTNLSMPVILGIETHNNSGVMTLGGPVYRGKTIVGFVSRRLEFSINKNHNNVNLKIDKTIKFERDNISIEVENEILPRFFVDKNLVIYFITKEISTGIFFIIDNKPMFYCSYT